MDGVPVFFLQFYNLVEVFINLNLIFYKGY
jgi:hypothetical protein